MTAVATSTGLHHEIRGEGEPILLVHGAAEDADLLSPLAGAFAERGFAAISYDRRGTRRSTREGWPEGGVEQHVADAAELLAQLAGRPARVLGLSSGGVLALELAVRRPDLVTQAIAWEPAAIGMLDGGDALHAQVMAPIEAHLAARPGDWPGAYDLLRAAMTRGTADLGDPREIAMRRNAEAAVRDDASLITRHRLDVTALDGAPVLIATSEQRDSLNSQIAEHLAALAGLPVWRVPGAADHEVYLNHPEVLAEAVRARR